MSGKNGHQTTESLFDKDGRPKNPERIFLHLRQEYVKDKNFERAQRTEKEVSLPVKFHRKWGKLRGTVTFFKEFEDGIRVDMVPSPGTILERWAVAHIWIPKVGSAGVLSPI